MWLFQMDQSCFTILITWYITINTYAETTTTTHFLIVYDGRYFKDQINAMNFTLLTSRTQATWQYMEIPLNKTLYNYILSEEYFTKNTFINNDTNNEQVIFFFADDAKLLSHFFGNSLILNYRTSISELVRNYFKLQEFLKAFEFSFIKLYVLKF